MTDNGIGCDLVCAGSPPLHTVPLFTFKQPPGRPPASDAFVVPHWILISYTDAVGQWPLPPCRVDAAPPPPPGALVLPAAATAQPPTALAAAAAPSPSPPADDEGAAMTGRSPLSSPLMAPVAGLRITKPTSPGVGTPPPTPTPLEPFDPIAFGEAADAYDAAVYGVRDSFAEGADGPPLFAALPVASATTSPYGPSGRYEAPLGSRLSDIEGLAPLPPAAAVADRRRRAGGMRGSFGSSSDSLHRRTPSDGSLIGNINAHSPMRRGTNGPISLIGPPAVAPIEIPRPGGGGGATADGTNSGDLAASPLFQRWRRRRAAAPERERLIAHRSTRRLKRCQDADGGIGLDDVDCRRPVASSPASPVGSLGCRVAGSVGGGSVVGSAGRRRFLPGGDPSSFRGSEGWIHRARSQRREEPAGPPGRAAELWS